MEFAAVVHVSSQRSHYSNMKFELVSLLSEKEKLKENSVCFSKIETCFTHMHIHYIHMNSVFAFAGVIV